MKPPTLLIAVLAAAILPGGLVRQFSTVADDCPTPSFAAPQSYDVGPNPFSVAIGDFNRDGNLDLAVANWGNSNNGNVAVLLGNGDGTFGSAVSYLTGTTLFCVTVGEFNGDGKPDLAVSGAGVWVLLGNGDGTFQTGLTVETGEPIPAVGMNERNLTS